MLMIRNEAYIYHWFRDLRHNAPLYPPSSENTAQNSFSMYNSQTIKQKINILINKKIHCF